MSGPRTLAGWCLTTQIGGEGEDDLVAKVVYYTVSCWLSRVW